MNIFQRNAKKLVVVPTIAGSASVIFIRLIEANQLTMGFYRLGFTLLLFAVPIISGGYKGYTAFTKKDFFYCGAAGVFLFGHFFCWFTAIKNTAIASAAVLGSVHPLVILFVTAVFMKHQVKVKSLIGIIIVLAGGAIIAGFDYSYAGSNTMGNAAAFMAAVCFGSYLLIGKFIGSKVPVLNYVFTVFGVSWFCFIAAMWMTGTAFAGYRKEDYLWLLAMAVICQIMGHVMYNWSMKYVSSLYVSVWVSLEAVFATVLGIIFFREVPEIWQYIGGAIAISGLLYYNYHEEERR